MRDLAYFEGEIRDASSKQEREAGFQIQAGARLHVFEGSDAGIVRYSMAGYGITIFT